MIARLGLAAAGFFLAAQPSLALAADDFYAGKQIRILVGSAGTGSYHAQASVLVKYLGKYIPGNPGFLIQAMPGAGGIKMATYMAGVAPNDGTVIATGFSNLPSAPLTSPNEAMFDTTKFGWIGSSTREVYVGYLWHTSQAKTFEDAKTMPVLVGGSGVGTFSIDSSLISNAVFGTKFKPIIGYKGGAETKLAVEKGEVDGVMGTNWSSLRREKDWLDNNRVRFMVQYGLTKNPSFPAEVPLFTDLAKTEEDRQLAKFWVANLEHAKPYFAPPGIPAERLALLRRAFDATMKDPDFLRDIQAAGEIIDGPMTGEALSQLVAEEMKTPPKVIQRISDAISAYLKDGNH